MAKSRTRLLALAAVAGAAVGVAAPPAQADGPVVTVVASGLDSPRLLTIAPTGDIFVAESGRGGDGPCAEHPELGELCFGTTGAITRVNPSGPDQRVVTGLPSIAGDEALGPMDVELTGGNTYVVSIGLAGHPDFRDQFGEDGALLGTLVTGKLSHSGFSLFADVAANEAASNPDGTDVDSNPTGIVRSGESYYVADAGGNAVVRASHKGSFSTLAVLPPGSALAPPFLGLPPGTEIPTDAVPTSVVKGPDGAYYISQLTGFPFEKGDSAIWRVVPGGQPTRWATGLTNVTDLAFSESGQLYAVQISAEGLLNGPIGSLVKVTPGGSTHETVVGGLFAPYGVALTEHAAYVSTCSVCTGGGQVVRVSLH